MKATFSEALLNESLYDNQSHQRELQELNNNLQPDQNFNKQIEVGEDEDGILYESLSQVAGGFIDGLNEMGTLFNYISGVDVSLPDISVGGFDLTVDGRLNTADDPTNGAYGFVRGLAQFATGFIPGLGFAKIPMLAAKGAGLARTATVLDNRYLKGLIAGGFADFTAFGANDPRMANFLREYGDLNGPITEYLSAPMGDEELDSELEGRFKNAIEGAGLGVFSEAIMHSMRWTKAGLHRTRDSLEKGETRNLEEILNNDETIDPLNGVEDGLSPQVDQGVRFESNEPVIFKGFTDEFKEGLGKRDVDFDDYTNGNTEGLDFNINKIEDDDQIRNTITGVENAFKDIGVLGRLGTGATETITDVTGKTRVGAKTHKLTKKETEKIVKTLAQDSLGTAEFINKTYMDVDGLTPKALAVQTLMQKSAKKLYELAEYVSRGDTHPDFRGLDVDHGLAKTQMAFQRQKAIHAGFQSEALGIKSEIGSALNALKITTKSKLAQDSQVEFFYNQFGGIGIIKKDAERVLRFAGDKDSVRKASKIAKGYEVGTLGKIKQSLMQVYINGILSGIDSTMANSFGNVTSVGTNVLERTLASGFNKTGKLFGGSGDGVQFTEAVSLAHGMKMGVVEGFWGGLYALRKDTPSQNMWVKQELAQRNVITAENFNVGGAFGSFIDLIGTATRIPSRLLMSNDEFFRGVSYNMEKHAQAYVFARKQLGDKTINNRVAFNELYNKIRNLGPEDLRKFADLEGIDIEAQQATLKAIFADPQKNKFLRAMDNGRQALPFGLGQVYIPFYNTILNILKFTGERTLGVQFLFDGTRWNDFRFKNGQRAGQLAMAKLATGSAMYSIAYQLAENGMITGSLPENLNQRMNLLEKGTTPYAFVTENGYVPFNRLDPIGTMLGLGADIHNLAKIINDPKYLEKEEREYHNTKLEDLKAQALYQVVNLLGDKAMLRGFSNLVGLITQDPLRKNEAEKQLYQAYNPLLSFYSAFRGDTARAYDQITRQTGSADFVTDLWNDYYKRNPEILRILGPRERPKNFSGNLMPRLNYIGEPVRASKYGNFGTDRFAHMAQAYLSPIPLRPRQKSPLINKIVELNVRSKPPAFWKSIITRGKFGTDTIALTAEERYFWAKTAGNLNKQFLQPMLSKPFFKSLPDGQQRLFIETSLRKHKQLAKEQLIMQFPRLDMRIQDFKLSDLEKMQKPATVNPAFLN